MARCLDAKPKDLLEILFEDILVAGLVVTFLHFLMTVAYLAAQSYMKQFCLFDFALGCHYI